MYLQIWKNFIASITRKWPAASEVGSDHFGNKYFEIPADPSHGKRRPSRWFEPCIKEKTDQEIPVEWEAWLRNRRANPPTKEEIEHNLAVMEMMKLKAAQLEEAARQERKEMGLLRPEDAKETGAFPKYEEYEETPGGSSARGRR